MKSSSENQRWLHFTQERFKPPSVWKMGKEELFQRVIFSLLSRSLPFMLLCSYFLCALHLFLLHGRQSHTVSVLKGLLFLFGSHERFLQKSHMACLFSPLLFFILRFLHLCPYGLSIEFDLMFVCRKALKLN